MTATSSPAAPAPIPGRLMAAGAAISSAAAIGMALYVHARLPVVLGGHGQSALLGALLVAAAALGGLLCAYLALIWTLASSILLVGPASRSGRALLGALRVLAPQLARRLTLGAAFATAATGLVLAPAVAADPAAPDHGTGRIAVSATLNPVSPMPAGGPGSPGPASPPAGGDQTPDPPGPPAADAEPDQQDAAPSGAGPDAPGRPTLGWPGPRSGEAADEVAPPSDAGASAASDPPPSSSPSTIEVGPGDSLWSITDDLLGPGLDDPDAIASLWPVLHDVNGDVIGTDPDHIEPGQVLIVPAQLSSQENS